jgi:hypothetical protein
VKDPERFYRSAENKRECGYLESSSLPKTGIQFKRSFIEKHKREYPISNME